MDRYGFTFLDGNRYEVTQDGLELSGRERARFSATFPWRALMHETLRLAQREQDLIKQRDAAREASNPLAIHLLRQLLTEIQAHHEEHESPLDTLIRLIREREQVDGDARVGRELVSILSDHAGDEGAVDTLKRIIGERDRWVVYAGKMQAQADDLAKEVDRLTAETLRDAAEIERLRGFCEQDQQLFREQRAEIDQLKASLKLADQTCGEMTSQLRDNAGEIARLKLDVQDLTNRLSAHGVDDLARENAFLRGRLRKRLDENSALLVEKDRLSSENAQRLAVERFQAALPQTKA